MNKKIRCLLVHDHVVLRQGLRRLLEDEPDIEVAAEAANEEEAVRRVFEQRPDVVIADAGVFDLTMEEVELLFSQASLVTRLIFLGGPESEEGDDARAGNCTERETSVPELVQMIRRICAGKGGLREAPRKPQLEWPAQNGDAPKRSLTTREREVLKLLAEGRTVRSAASVLGLSVKTVDAHKFNLMRKLGIHNKTELVMWAIQRRLVKVPVNS